VVKNFTRTPFGKTLIRFLTFSCFLGMFGPFFGDATPIIFTCHSGRELFRAQYDRHDVPSILQAKIRCFEMSAADETMK